MTISIFYLTDHFSTKVASMEYYSGNTKGSLNVVLLGRQISPLSQAFAKNPMLNNKRLFDSPLLSNLPRSRAKLLRSLSRTFYTQKTLRHHEAKQVKAKFEQRRRAKARARCSTRAPPPCSPIRRAREAGSAESTLTHTGYCTVTVRSTTSIPRPPSFSVTRGPNRLKANICKRLSSCHQEVKEVLSITPPSPKSPSQAHLQKPKV